MVNVGGYIKVSLPNSIVEVEDNDKKRITFYIHNNRWL
jgi:hypothetical protein